MLIKLKLKGKLSIFLRYMFSFLIVFLVPLVILFLFIYPQVMAIITNKVMEGNLDAITHVENAMALQFQNIYKLPTEISNDRALAKYNLTSDSYNELLGIEELAKYLNTNHFVFNSILYWKGQNRLFSNKVIFDFKEINYPGLFYYFPRWSHSRFLRDINTVITPTGPIVRPAEPVYCYGTRYDLITFIFSIPRTSNISSGTLLIFVEEKTIHQLLKTSSPHNDSNIIIVSDRGDIITALHKDNWVYMKETREIIAGIKNKGSAIYRIDGKKYIVSYVRSRNGWKYIDFTPLMTAQKELIQLKTSILIFFFIIVFSEIWIIYLAMKANYYPIKSIVKVAQGLLGSEKTRGMNEFELIKTALKNISISKENLQWCEERSRFSARNAFLVEIINGNIQSPEQLRKMAADFDLDFLYHRFTAFIISLHSEQPIDFMQLKQLLLKYEQEKGQEVQAYFLIDLDMRKVTAVSNQSNDKSLYPYLESLKNGIQNELDCNALIGVGGTRDELLNVYQSYNEALTAIDYVNMKKTSPIIFYPDIPINKAKATIFPTNSLYLLDLAILKNDFSQVKELVASIIDMMMSDNTPVSMIRIIYYSVINVLIRGLLKFKSVRAESKLNLASSSLFIDSCTLVQLVSLIQETTDKLCELMIQSSLSVRNSLINEIIKYIEANYLDPCFSIQVVAEHFNMTVSNFSHYFKSNIQQNFKAYLDNLRINKAKELLLNSPEPVEEIAQRVCYSNSSNFSRGFKKVTGMTPGEFRKN